MPICTFPPEARNSLQPLYSREIRLRAVLDSVLEGHLGEAQADDRVRPTVARLRLGCYAIFAGDPRAPLAEALVRDVPAPLELIVPRSVDWESLVRRVHTGKISERPMRGYSAAETRLEEVRGMAARVPPGFAIRPIDAALAIRLEPHLRPHGMQVMDDPTDFAARSGGVAAVVDFTPHATIPVCAATNYAFSSRSIELAIATHPDYRGRGLATCVAATWVSRCLERGITPHWNASNPVSQRLAERLGFRPDHVVEVLYLESRLEGSTA